MHDGGVTSTRGRRFDSRNRNGHEIHPAPQEFVRQVLYNLRRMTDAGNFNATEIRFLKTGHQSITLKKTGEQSTGAH